VASQARATASAIRFRIQVFDPLEPSIAKQKTA